MKKKSVGRPKGTNNKVLYSTRLSTEVVAIIKSKPNQAEFIENLVIECNKAVTN